ncbi:MAG: hypothetical protein JNJ50_05695 [Acidobacteria bacterium]|nr:hypothetical protein [Acidobacteriota bacterium]
MKRKKGRAFRTFKDMAMGGKSKATSLRRQAAELRRQANACEHGDEEVLYESAAAADADASRPPVICPKCERPKLRVAITMSEADISLSPESQERVEEFIIPGLLK